VEIKATLDIHAELAQGCTYGENPRQKPAALYRKLGNDDPLAIHNFKVVAGNTPSFNNYCDIDRGLQTLTHIAASLHRNRRGKLLSIAIGMKHGNACGAAIWGGPSGALVEMAKGDPRALFGGMVMTNFPITLGLAETLAYAGKAINEKQLFDVVVAPSFSEEAIEVLARKSGKCRLIVNPALTNLTEESLAFEPRIRQVRGGFLVQPNYTFVLDLKDPALVHYGFSPLTPNEEDDLLLAQAIGSTSTSNTITIVKDGQLIGNGVGQQDRVGCCELAIKRARDAGHEVTGAVAYSDSFFPFPDGPTVLADASISAILTSSGSLNDNLTQDVCNERGVQLLMFPDEFCRGFYGH